MMVVEPSPSLPQTATVLKQWNRVHMELIEHSSEAAQPLVEGVLRTLSGDTSATWAWLDSYLLGDTCNIRPECSFLISYWVEPLESTAQLD